MAGEGYPKIGLALGSGGAKGLAHIGIIKVLEKNNIPIDFIAGSSIGAFIGAHYAAYKDIPKLEEIVFGLNRAKGFQLFDPTWKGGLMKGHKTEQFIADVLDGASFESLQIPYVAVATDLNTAEAVALRSGDLVRAVRISASVPAFFQPVIHHKRLLADGGLSNPIPVDVATQMGADVVIAVNLDTVYVEKALHEMPAISKVPIHSINILRHNLALQSAKTADVVISPKDKLQIGLLGWNTLFSSERAKLIIEAGEEAAEEAMPYIKAIIARRERERTKVGKVLRFIQRVRNF